MSDLRDTFATAVGCMDGRVQGPITKYAKKKWGVKYVDAITEAGLVKHFEKEHEAHPYTPHIKETIKIKVVDVSVMKHHSKGIIVHGHQDCAGNPVSDEKQKAGIIEAAKIIGELEHGVEVVPVFVQKADPEWKVVRL